MTLQNIIDEYLNSNNINNRYITKEIFTKLLQINIVSVGGIYNALKLIVEQNTSDESLKQLFLITELIEDISNNSIENEHKYFNDMFEMVTNKSTPKLYKYIIYYDNNKHIVLETNELFSRKEDVIVEAVIQKRLNNEKAKTITKIVQINSEKDIG